MENAVLAKLQITHAVEYRMVDWDKKEKTFIWINGQSQADVSCSDLLHSPEIAFENLYGGYQDMP